MKSGEEAPLMSGDTADDGADTAANNTEVASTATSDASLVKSDPSAVSTQETHTTPIENGQDAAPEAADTGGAGLGPLSENLRGSARLSIPTKSVGNAVWDLGDDEDDNGEETDFFF